MGVARLGPEEMAYFGDPDRRDPRAVRADEQLRDYADRTGGLTLQMWRLISGYVWGQPHMMTMDEAAKRLARPVHELQQVQLETNHALGWATADQPSQVDLRVPALEQFADVLTRVEQGLSVQLERESLRRKRRTMGARSDRGTWVRIETAPATRVIRQGWGGVEAAGALTGVAKPAWYQSVAWADRTGAMWWRADEIALVAEAPVSTGATLKEDPGLADSWWATLCASLATLQRQSTTQLAKHSVSFSQGGIESLVNELAEPAGVAVESTICEWTTAHADLSWANLTGPQCWSLDWEDWGTAPRGLDAATLLLLSLAVPAVAERIRREFAADLDSRSGRLVTLALIAELIREPAYAGVLFEPARHEAISLMEALRR